MANTSQIQITAEAGKGFIKMHGRVSSWNAELFEFDADRLLEQGVTDLEIDLDTIGGDAIAGNKMANIIAKFPGTRTCIMGVMVASAGTYIAMKCQVRKMPKNGQAMIHKPESELKGNQDKIEADLQLLRNITDNYRTVYAEAFGKTEKQIDALWKENLWLSAEQALELGFATEIIDEIEVDAESVARITAMGSPIEIPRKESINTDMSKIPLIAAALQLPEAAGEAEVLAAVKKNIVELHTAQGTIEKLNGELKEMKDKATADQEARVTALVDGAIKEGKITEKERERYTKLAGSDFAEVSAILLEKPAHRTVTSQIGKETGADDQYKGWDFQKFQKEAPAVLAKIKAEEPERFATLYEAFKVSVNAEAKR